MFNHHYEHLWVGKNTHGMRPRVAQKLFVKHICTGVVGDLSVGIARLTSKDFLMFLPLTTFEPVPQHTRCHMWFQHNRTPTHYGRCEHSNYVFDPRWQIGPFIRLLRSPIVCSMEFSSLECTEKCCYVTPVDSEMDLIPRVICAAANIP